MPSNLRVINNNFTSSELAENRIEGLKKALEKSDDTHLEEMVHLLCWYIERYYEHPYYDQMIAALMVALTYYEASFTEK